MNVNIFSFDSNNRLCAFLQDEEARTSAKNLAVRVGYAALPFLQMHTLAGVGIAVASAAIQSAKLLNSAVNDYREGRYVETSKKAVKVAYLCASAAAMVIYPLAGLLATHSAQLVIDLYHCAFHLKAGDYTEAAKASLRMLQTALYVSSVIYATPELLALSLLAQAAGEMRKAVSEFSQGHYLEAFANLLLASIRTHRALPHIKIIHRNWFGAELSQGDLDAFLRGLDYSGEDMVDFEEYLKRNNFSNKLNELSFEKYRISNMAFKNISLKNCAFDNAYFNRVLFNRVSFDDCRLVRTQMVDSLFQKVRFSHCDISLAEFNWSSFKDVEWHDCNMTGAIFNDASLTSVSYNFCKLLETCFFNAEVADGEMVESDLTDCLLMDARDKFTTTGGIPHRITRPIVGLPWNFESVGYFTNMINEAAKDCGGIVFRFHSLPRNVDELALESEVRGILNEAPSRDHIPEGSLPKYLLRAAPANSEIAKIKRVVSDVAEYLDALIIPGGADVHPEFYGAERGPQTYTESGYCHSMFEFSLLEQAERQHIPTLGICRGAQMINVFLGGTLEQHVDGQYGVSQDLTIDSQQTGLAAEIGHKILQGDAIVGISMHHQAISSPGQGVHKLIAHEGVPKLLISGDGNFIMSQFHPEVYLHTRLNEYGLYKNNRNFFAHLIGKGNIVA